MSFRPWLFSLVLAGACTAPPLQQPPAPAPARERELVRVELAAPGLPAAEIELQAVAPLERALSGLPGLKALHARADDGVAELALDWPAPDLEAARVAIEAARRELSPAFGAPVRPVMPDHALATLSRARKSGSASLAASASSR